MSSCAPRELPDRMLVILSTQTHPLDFSRTGGQAKHTVVNSSGVQKHSVAPSLTKTAANGQPPSKTLISMNDCSSQNNNVKSGSLPLKIKEEILDEDELSEATYDFILSRSSPDSTEIKSCIAEPKICMAPGIDIKIEGHECKENTENNRKFLDRGDSPSQHGKVHSEYDCDIYPQVLVRALAIYSDLSASLQELLDCNLQPSSVKKVVEKYPYIFHLQDDMIELRPDIKICKPYCSPKGCENRRSCPDLHICGKYIMNKCDDSECVLGHKWDTGHNCCILKKFFLDTLSSHSLEKIFKGRIDLPSVDDCIGVCRPYNKEGCNSQPCLSLHICLPFLIELMKGNSSLCHQDCLLNHDLLHPSCVDILEKHGISTNESKRDIALDIQSSNPFLYYEEIRSSYQENNIISQFIDNIHKKPPECSDYNSSKRRKRKRYSYNVDKEKAEKSSTNSLQTVWSHYLKGGVPIPEICFYSVESMCNFENSSCQRLHSASHFYWQVSEQGGEWLNLRPNQVKCLERAYCEPSKNAVTLPRLDPASLDDSVKGLFILMGRDSWFSDFFTMTLTNSSASKVLYIRRLCSEKVNGVEITASKYVWYFLDQRDVWIQYGKPDSLGNTALTSSITSDQIEEIYQDNPSASIQFTNAQFTYELNFQLMLQVNLTTSKTRQVLRRPQPHLQDEGLEDLPQTWNVMLPRQRMQRVALLGVSPEYKAVLDLLSRNPNANYKWMSIERIQNPYLWRAYQNKVKEMTSMYGSSLAVDVRYLFHGTSYDKVKNICEENFDWRLHGAANGQAFGRGTYFATDYNYACTFAKPDANGYRYLFVVSVAVGTKTNGNPFMQRPPVNPSTSLPFDSSVNNMINPTIIVKYDKQEYYPEYLVIFC